MNSPADYIQTLDDPVLKDANIDVNVLRLDKYTPCASGNKYFKLKYNVEAAKQQGYDRLLSFGGAFSNHIHALAIAGQKHQMKTIGFIRGDEQQILNDTLEDAVTAGMSLHYVSRKEYRLRNNEDYLAEIQEKYPDAYIIPEGGCNALGVKGCLEILNLVTEDFDTVILPCGTASTLAGIIMSAPEKQVVGVSVLKGGHYLNDEVFKFSMQLNIPCGNHWLISHDYHCGGYAKLSKPLAQFMVDFEERNTIPVEPIYSGKMFFALYQMIAKGDISPGSRVVAIHTGGMQGLRGKRQELANLLSA
jgi:1-aminocyclopropane-1-carboxylate deaminase